jgi:hypothetical protein
MTMTRLFQQALSALEPLPAAARLLEALDDWYWERQFAATTPAQWDRILARVRAEIASGDSVPMSEVDWEVT